MKITKKFTIIALTLAAILTAGGFLAAQFGFFSGGTNAPSVPEDTMTRGLVGYWSFDEGSGSTAYDASGNGNDGTLINDPKWTAGKSGSALQFDGVDDYVDCGNDESLNITDAITIEAWIKWTIDPSTTSDNWPTIVNRANDNGYRLAHSQTATYFEFGVIKASGGYIASTTSPVKDVWYHVVGTYDLSKLRIYVNGKFENDFDLTGSISSNNYHTIIGDRSALDRSFTGSIDEVRIYNRALSAEEIRYHYNHGGPVASWNFDEGSGTVIHDSSGNGFDGTLNE